MIFTEGTMDALGLIVGDYPETSNLPSSDMLSRRSMGPTWYWSSGSANLADPEFEVILRH